MFGLKMLGVALLGIFLFAIEVFILGVATMFVWNNIVIDLIGMDFNTITLVNALILSVFTKLIFGGRK